MRLLLLESVIHSSGAHFSDWLLNTSQVARRKAVGNIGGALIISESKG
jgi:hypothetical protein